MGAGQGAAAPGSGTAAPDFTARDVDGKTFRLSDHLGKGVILLDFWSTFCEPCKAEFPHLNAMYAAKKDKGLLVLGVAMCPRS
jgi:peroxiredoxin